MDVGLSCEHAQHSELVDLRTAPECPSSVGPAAPPPAPRPAPGERPTGRWRTDEKVHAVDPQEAVEFLRLFHTENPSAGPSLPREREVVREIAEHGTYAHTGAELVHGARVAWRNSNRCIGRLYWQSLKIRDRRHVSTARGVFDEVVEHLHVATNGGQVRPVITVFAPPAPGERGIRIRNEQLVRYAGHRVPGAGGGSEVSVVGDPATADLTAAAQALGWQGAGTPFDVLPLLIDVPGEPTRLYPVPADAVHEVALEHPEHAWFAELGLRWYAVPAIADMHLEIGGITYTAAPFNGWYMGTEIGARNLADADRYDLLPEVACRLGLDTSSDRTLWKDRALVELNVAVLHSYAAAGVTVVDHHTESRRFLTHLEREERAGRIVPADWSWIVPPISGAATPVFHRYYDDAHLTPRYVHPPRP